MVVKDCADIAPKGLAGMNDAIREHMSSDNSRPLCRILEPSGWSCIGHTIGHKHSCPWSRARPFVVCRVCRVAVEFAHDVHRSCRGE